MDAAIPHDDSTPQRSRRKPSSATTLWLFVVGSVVWMSLTACACGWTTWYTTIVVLPLFCLGCRTFFKVSRASRIAQLLAAAAFGLLAVILLKNVSDMIAGHP
jgi:hypothetical protein